MFGTIRKHQTWLWAIIITLTIISFVIFFSPYSKLNPGQGEARLGSIDGKKISEEEFILAQREATLHYFFMSGGRWPDQDTRQSQYDPERETYQWLFLLRKAEAMNIHVPVDSVVQVARNMISQFQQAGINNAQVFGKQVLEPRGLSLNDFERFVRHYLAVQEIVAIHGASGKLIAPDEAKALWIRENQEVAADAVFFSISNQVANVKITPELISQYYSNRLAEYRLPERVQVKYVEFGVSNFISMAESELAKTNLAEIVDANLQRMGTNYTEFGKTPEEAKASIREKLIKNRALVEARRKAAEFATKLFEMEPVKLSNFDDLAKTRSLEVKVSEPFGRNETPKGLDVTESFARTAFSLDATNDLFSSPVVGENAVYVMAFERRIPSEIPPFEQVHEKVTEDYKRMQAGILTRQAGISFHQSLTNSMAQGKDFATVVKDAKLELVTLPPFSIATRSLPDLGHRVDVRMLKEMAFSLQPGQVSSFQATVDGGLILHLKSKLPIDESKLAKELPNFVSYLRQSRQTEAFNEWFRKEATTGLRDTPLGQPRPQPAEMTATPRAKS